MTRSGSLIILPATATDESVLVEGLRTGNAAAYQSLYVLYADRVIAVVRLLLPDAFVDDAVQDTFISVYKGIDSFRSDARLGTWIHRIAFNTAMTSLRRQGARKRAESVIADHQQEPADAEAGAIDRLAGDTLFTLLKQLDPPKRTAFWLHHVAGMTAVEIGEILGEQRGTVLKRLQRTRVELTQAWQELENRPQLRRQGGEP